MTLDMVIPFLDKIPRTQSMKEIIDKLEFIKIKNVCSLNVKKIRQAKNWEKIFAKVISDKGMKYIHTHKTKTLNKKIVIISLKNGPKTLTDT